MFETLYEKLGSTDQETFARIVNKLLAHTFLLSEEYDAGEGITKVNREYLFAERNFEMLETYFRYGGFSLEKDNNYGVIRLVSSYEGNRVSFDKLTTLLVYALRLMYEEEREKFSLSDLVIITLGDLVHKLVNIGAVPKKPANNLLQSSLQMLSRFRFLDRLDGGWTEPGTRFLIRPTILFAVSNEQISNLARLAAQEEPEGFDAEAEADVDAREQDGPDDLE